MTKFFSGRTSMCNAFCAVLLVILLVLQFMPFWHYGENNESAASINAYVWLPTEYGDLEKHLEEQVGDEFSLNSIILMPILVLVTGVLGIVLSILKSGNPFSAIPAVLAGISGIWGYLSEPVFRLGANWQLHLVVCIALLAIAAVSLILSIREMKKQ